MKFEDYFAITIGTITVGLIIAFIVQHYVI